MTALPKTQLEKACADILEGTAIWRIWFTLGNSELRQRYRRSVLGPLWVMLSMAVQALVMGFLLGYLFKMDLPKFLPFLCISLITWSFISTTIIEGASCFVTQGLTILQARRPYWTYMMLILWRNVIIYSHTFIVFVGAALVFGVYPTHTYLLALPGLALLVINVAWMSLMAGLLSARFRDVPMIIQNAFNPLVWMTPVYYQADQLGPTTRLIIEINPLTYMLEIARMPFLNHAPSGQYWMIAIGIAVVGWSITFSLFVRVRSRIPYWL